MAAFEIGDAGFNPTWNVRTETDIKEQLVSERFHLDRIKSEYLALKSDHLRLQDEQTLLKAEIRTMSDEREKTFEEFGNLLEQSRFDLTIKQAECELYKNRMLNPDKVDLIRNEVFQEVENFFQNKFLSLNADLEKYRKESSKAADDLAMVEAILKTKEKDHNLALERMKHDYVEKISDLKKENEFLRNLVSSDSVSCDKHRMSTDREDQRIPFLENHRLEFLKNEKMHMELEIGKLRTEVDCFKRTMENKELEMAHLKSLQARQIQDKDAQSRQLESENGMLTIETNELRRELEKSNKLLKSMSSRQVELEREISMLRNRVDDAESQRHHESEANRLELTGQKKLYERELEKLRQSQSEAARELNVALASNVKLEKAATERERCLMKQTQAAVEAESQKHQIFETEKIGLLAKYSRLEFKYKQSSEELLRIREQLEEEIGKADELKKLTEKNTLNKLKSLESQLEQERTLSKNSKLEIQQLQLKYNECLSSEKAENDAKKELENCVQKANLALREGQTAWMMERQGLMKEKEEMESKFTRLYLKMSNFMKIYHEKKREWKERDGAQNEQIVALQTELKLGRVREEKFQTYDACQQYKSQTPTLPMHIVQQHSNQKPVFSLNMDETNRRRMLEKDGMQDDDPRLRLLSDIVEQQPPVMNNRISSAISHRNDCTTSVGEFRLVIDIQNEKMRVGSMNSTDCIPSVQSSTRACREIACQFPGPEDTCKSNSSPNVLYESELNLKECQAVDCQFPSPREILDSSSYTASSNAPEQHFSMEDLSRERHEMACQCPTPRGIIKNHPCLTLSCSSTLPHCCVSKECHEFACQFPCAHSILDNLSSTLSLTKLCLKALSNEHSKRCLAFAGQCSNPSEVGERDTETMPSSTVLESHGTNIQSDHTRVCHESTCRDPDVELNDAPVLPLTQLCIKAQSNKPQKEYRVIACQFPSPRDGMECNKNTLSSTVTELRDTNTVSSDVLHESHEFACRFPSRPSDVLTLAMLLPNSKTERSRNLRNESLDPAQLPNTRNASKNYSSGGRLNSSAFFPLKVSNVANNRLYPILERQRRMSGISNRDNMPVDSIGPDLTPTHTSHFLSGKDEINNDFKLRLDDLLQRHRHFATVLFDDDQFVENKFPGNENSSSSGSKMVPDIYQIEKADETKRHLNELLRKQQRFASMLFCADDNVKIENAWETDTHGEIMEEEEFMGRTNEWEYNLVTPNKYRRVRFFDEN